MHEDRGTAGRGTERNRRAGLSGLCSDLLSVACAQATERPHSPLAVCEEGERSATPLQALPRAREHARAAADY